MIQWRPLKPDDGPDLEVLFGLWESHHELPFHTDLEEIEHDLSNPDGDIANRTQVAIGEHGRFLAIAWVSADKASVEVAKHRAMLEVIAHPDHAQLEAEALEWAEAKGREILEEHQDGKPRVLRAWSPAKLTDRIERFTAAGYPPARYFAEMLCGLEDSLPDAAPPEDVTLIDWDDSLMEEVWRVSNTAFADHWGTVRRDYESWRRIMVDEPHHRPDLGIIALADGDVVGYCSNRVYEGDFELRKMKEGYIASLGVLPEWRKRGIASALIADSLRRFAAVGYDHASLHVDADSPTGAFGLYERLGFKQSDLTVALVKEL
ncbi:MAG: GNAT family N-acetyltransferase [Acidimicrobiia bacterium]|nr:GNAT family N-acetyltransferase [Acidimicrobiia bacterium]MDH3471248.1 GNAT family N-acetyltransferase [Acidimicrobiia bacterium]